MFDVSAAIAGMEQAGMLPKGDRHFYANEKPSSSGAFWGGAIGAAVAQSNATKYIGCFNEQQGIALYEMNADGTPTHGRHVIDFNQMQRVKVGGMWGGYVISITINGGKRFDFVIPKVIKNYSPQKEHYEYIRNFLKAKQK